MQNRRVVERTISMKTSILYNALELIPPQYRTKGWVLIFLLIIGSLLDLLSLASFLPIVIIIINPEQTGSNPLVSKLSGLSGLNDPVHLAIALTLCVLLFILVKTQLISLITYWKATYAYNIANDLATRSLANYLRTPVIQFTNMDYALELNKISNAPLVFANNLIIPAGTIISEFLILFFLFVSLVLYDIKILGFILLVISPVLLIYFYRRKKSKAISNKIKTIYPRLLKYTLQAIEGLLEIRAFHKESFFKKRFNETYQELAKTFSDDHSAQTSTLRMTELVAAISVCLLIIYTLVSKQNTQQSILLLSIYAGVSFRAIPSVNRVMSALLQMKTHEYVVPQLNQMVKIQNDNEPEQSNKMHFENQLELRNISFQYEGQRSILKRANLSIRKGEKIIIVGRSGVGKTTLFLILMRLLQEQEGEIFVDGQKLTEENTLSWQKLIGYVPQNPYVLDASLVENIAFGMPAEKINLERVKKLIKDLDLEEWMNNLPDGLNSIIGERGAKVSGGQRQRLAIARALYHDAEVLLLDEITNQIDRETELAIKHLLENLAVENKTVILITHRSELLNFADSIYQIKGGSFERIANASVLK